MKKKNKEKLKEEAIKLSKVKQNYQKYYDDFKNNRFKMDTQKFEIAKDEFYLLCKNMKIC